jgi:hypothetical protein
VHEAVVDLKEKLEALHTFYLLASKILNKRAHPTQWQLNEGRVSDVLKNFDSFTESFVALRFSLKTALPLIGNKMMEEEVKLADCLTSFEEKNGKDLIELIVRELAEAEVLTKGLVESIPSTQKHVDYEDCLVRNWFFVCFFKKIFLLVAEAQH